MSTEIKVPKLPESVADATLVTWHKKPGDAVARDENLADLETDKVVLEVPAPVAGVLKEIKVPAGTTVTSDQLLAIVEAGATAAVAAPAAAAPAAKSAAPATVAAAAPVSTAAKSGPAARRAASESGADVSKIAGSGLGGAVTKADVLAAPAPVTGLAAGSRVERRVPMTRLRARIAERLVTAQATQALLTTFNEVDLLAVQELRARYKDKFEKNHGVKLGFSSFFVRATIEALKRFPVINAAVDGNDIVYREFYDIGMAVSTERGLVVPVLRDADLLSFAQIEKAVGDFAGRARSGSLTMEDLTGGTFSITNGGVFGSLLSTPIVNAPQSAILGMHKIQERPVAVDGQVVIRPMMYLALTYDHRIIDGKEAVQFLVTIKECLEDPGRLLLGV
ncbi:MAG: 2-oxoglutarate dehydrogenase complex dihydrolipoyllysine-residue succinyltransferase [Proteobacteria bacterium]|jgi:2-oxoglutarate dehydrogenase E2 component (dihydrolipoamide succinyltransferase)|nr:2-oxoglutarate dehydrogenase complex dihydrolipoyllysine-residue succinyltransferase [Pseudomonadota bacterium]MBK9253072.1 2-oxoglutarate dehydrogenase complex dihydrolipoyllysine-residue succinyltransferase [Pseudomonadota bacterium]